MRVKWSNDTTGLIKIWVNGSLRYSYDGVTNYTPNYIRIGIDKWDWRYKWNISTTTTREIYIDEFRIGDSLATYSDVSPSIFTPLAVLYTKDLEARKVNEGVKLTWEAEVTSNFSVFEVERSFNGTNFYSLGKVYKNNTNIYEFYDKLPSSDNFYRIKQVSIGESSTYSRIAVVRYLNSPRRVHIYDMIGRHIKTITISNLNEIRTLSLAKGVYILVYDDGTSKQFVIN